MKPVAQGDMSGDRNFLSPAPGNRDTGESNTKGLSYKRSSVQLQSIDQTRQIYVQWIARTSDEINHALHRLLWDLRSDYSASVERLRTLNDELSHRDTPWGANGEQLPALHGLLTKYMSALEMSKEAAKEVLATTPNESTTLFGGNNKEEALFQSSRTVRNRFLMTLRTPRPTGDIRTAITKFLDVVDKSMLGLEALKSSMNLIESFESERLQLQQALAEQPQHLEFVKELSPLHMRLTWETQSEETYYNEKILPLLWKLHNPSVSYENRANAHVLRYSEASGKRLKGTCDWLVNDVRFFSWLKNPPPQILWCWGPAGTGKSISTARVIEILHRSDRKYAYYFLGQGKVQTASGVFLSLLGQLCHDQTVLQSVMDLLLATGSNDLWKHRERKAIDDATDYARPTQKVDRLLAKGRSSWNATGTKSMSNELAASLNPDHSYAGHEHKTRNADEGHDQKIAPSDQLRIAFRSVCDQLEDITIILDGWDETNMSSKIQFDEILTGLCEMGCRLYVTSRNDPSSSIVPRPLEIHIESEDNDADIVAMVRKTLQIQIEGDTILSTLWKKVQYDRVARFVTQISHGTFTLANVQMINLLDQGRRDSGGRSLEEIAFGLSPNRSRTIEHGLKVFDNESDEVAMVIKTVLIWVTNSTWPISSPALREALPLLLKRLFGVFISGKIQMLNILSHLDAFLSVDQGNSLIHLVFDEIKHAVESVWPVQAESILALANMGIDYLSLGEFGNGCRLSETALVNLLKKHPFLEHACHSWTDYVRLFEKMREEKSAQKASAQAQSHQFTFQTKKTAIKIHPGFGTRHSTDSMNAPKLVIAPENVRYWSIPRTDSGEMTTNRIEVETTQVRGSHRTIATWRESEDEKMAERRFANSKITPSGKSNFRGHSISEVSNQDPRDELRIRLEDLIKKPNIRLAMQVLLYTDPDHHRLGFLWEEFVAWIESMSTLQIAARFGLKSLVERNLDHKSVSKSDLRGSTPLHAAAVSGGEEVVALLLDAGAKTVAKDSSGKTPIDLAKEHGHGKVFTTLFERFCETNERDPFDINDLISYYARGINDADDEKRLRELALVRSVQDGKTAVVRRLVANGVCPDCTTEEGMPVLHICVRKNDLNMLETLLSCGANPSIVSTDSSAISTLHVAARGGQLDTISLLVAAGADPRTVDRHGQTVLFPALDAPDEKMIVRTTSFLLKRGVDPNKKANDGKQLLHKAALKGMLKLCKALLEWGVDDINPQDNDGLTPLEYAEKGGYTELSDLFRQVLSV